jgi:preprotein translocase subunit SecD
MKVLILFIASALLTVANATEIGVYRVEPGPTAASRELKFASERGSETLFVDSTPVISTDDFIAAETKGGKLSLRLSQAAQIRFTELTKERSQGGRLGRIAIVLDGVVVLAPIIRSEFKSQWIPVGAASPQQVDAVRAAIQASSKKS